MLPQRNEETITFEGARLLFRNFAGEEKQFNPAGRRNFCVVIPDELVDPLLKDGWNVKTLQPREEGDAPTSILKVMVSYKARPPKVAMISSKGRTNLGEDEIELLDWADMSNVDLIVRPYNWEVGGKAGVSAYLQTMFVTIREDELELKYADMEI